MVVLNTGLAASFSAWACYLERLNSHAVNGNTAGGLVHCCDMATIIILEVARQFEAGLPELDGRAYEAVRAAQRAQWWLLDVVLRQQAPRRADRLARARCRHPTTWAPLACILRAAGIAVGLPAFSGAGRAGRGRKVTCSTFRWDTGTVLVLRPRAAEQAGLAEAERSRVPAQTSASVGGTTSRDRPHES